MYTVGLPIPRKEHENRRALRPEDVKNMTMPGSLYFEKGYGNILGYADGEYLAAGANVTYIEKVLAQPVICDVKVGDADYLATIQEQTILFGWVHAAETPERFQLLKDKKLSAYAWENMYEHGRHLFAKNNELAGASSVLHACMDHGLLPGGKKVAILGNGNTARGAMKVLLQLGAQVDVFTRKMEKSFQEHFMEYDILVNCILWDVTRTQHILNKEDIHKMKSGAMIIDVACDDACAIETIHPTTYEHPSYEVDGIYHYAYDHSPSLFYRTFMDENAAIIAYYLDDLMMERKNEVLQQAFIMNQGVVLDPAIERYLKRNHTNI